MAARSVTKLTILALSLGALLTQSPLVFAQSSTPAEHTAGLDQIIAAVTVAPAQRAVPEPTRQALYPSFSKQLDGIFSELLRRPSALAPQPFAGKTGRNAQGLTDMLDRARQPHAPRQASAPAFSLDDVVAKSLLPSAASLQPAYGAEHSRRRALVDALRVAVPSDGDILR